jgi:hypothetical protein
MIGRESHVHGWVDMCQLQLEASAESSGVFAKVAELADAPDLGSGVLVACGFNSRPSHPHRFSARRFPRSVFHAGLR